MDGEEIRTEYRGKKTGIGEDGGPFGLQRSKGGVQI